MAPTQGDNLLSIWVVTTISHRSSAALSSCMVVITQHATLMPPQMKLLSRPLFSEFNICAQSYLNACEGSIVHTCMHIIQYTVH